MEVELVPHTLNPLSLETVLFDVFRSSISAACGRSWKALSFVLRNVSSRGSFYGDEIERMIMVVVHKTQRVRSFVWLTKVRVTPSEKNCIFRNSRAFKVQSELKQNSELIRGSASISVKIIIPNVIILFDNELVLNNE